MGRIAGNQRMVVAEMDRLRLDALLYPVDGRGGARSDESPDITCFIASTAGLPAAAFPIGLTHAGCRSDSNCWDARMPTKLCSQ